VLTERRRRLRLRPDEITSSRRLVIARSGSDEAIQGLWTPQFPELLPHRHAIRNRHEIILLGPVGDIAQVRWIEIARRR
jgi:hypothetical protein